MADVRRQNMMIMDMLTNAQERAANLRAFACVFIFRAEGGGCLFVCLGVDMKAETKSSVARLLGISQRMCVCVCRVVCVVLCVVCCVLCVACCMCE